MANGKQNTKNENTELEASEVAHKTADAIDHCNAAANMLRSQAAITKSLSATIEMQAEGLASDIETSGKRFARMIELFEQSVQQTRLVIEQEQKRLVQFEEPNVLVPALPSSNAAALATTEQVEGLDKTLKEWGRKK